MAILFLSILVLFKTRISKSYIHQPDYNNTSPEFFHLLFYKKLDTFLKRDYYDFIKTH